MFLCIGLLSLFHSFENDPVNHTCTRHLTVFKKKKRVAQGLIAVLVQLRYHMLVFPPPSANVFVPLILCFCIKSLQKHTTCSVAVNEWMPSRRSPDVGLHVD